MLEKVSGADTLLAEKRQRLLVLQTARQSNRPLHQQLRDLDSKLERKQRALKRRKDEELPSLQKAVDDAKAKLEKTMSDTKDLEREVEKLAPVQLTSL